MKPKKKKEKNHLPLTNGDDRMSHLVAMAGPLHACKYQNPSFFNSHHYKLQN